MLAFVVQFPLLQDKAHKPTPRNVLLVALDVLAIASLVVLYFLKSTGYPARAAFLTAPCNTLLLLLCATSAFPESKYAHVTFNMIIRYPP